MQARNKPCPCGSGRRHKHCCGAIDAAATPAESTPEVAPIPARADGSPTLSIVLPWFRKLSEFRQVLPLNAPYFARPGIEVILVLDEPSEEDGLLALIDQHRQIRWQVLVNDQPHSWRPPCCAINVGLRHARGQRVLVASPESAFVSDVPFIALRAAIDHPQAAILGQVAHARFDEIDSRDSLVPVYSGKLTDPMHYRTFYGSLCAPLEALQRIGGYDESIDSWGGDDDNLRVRLEMAGHANVLCPAMQLLHLADAARDGGEWYDEDNDFRRCSPTRARANGKQWGRDFSRRAVLAEPPTPTGQQPTDPRRVLPNVPAEPIGSRAQCQACGRLIHHEPAVFPCRACSAPPTPEIIPNRPAIACVMQLRNEQQDLPGCLDHLRDHVDGVIALDDGSIDRTRELLENDPAVVETLTNPAQDDHHWNEPANRQRLLQQARELGFDWVLVCDADERYELQFLEHTRDIAGALADSDVAALSLSLREMWDDPLHYRIDGPWDRKARARFFRLPDQISFSDDKAYHGDWLPDALRKPGVLMRTRHQIYHLKMILRADREARRDLYQRLDPDNRLQPQGYDYLVEEGPELRRERIAPGRAYDLETLPTRYRALLGEP